MEIEMSVVSRVSYIGNTWIGDGLGWGHTWFEDGLVWGEASLRCVTPWVAKV